MHITSTPCLALAFVLANAPGIARADPLHSIARDAYWHHESNFIFPLTAGGLVRVGVPQELDGSSTVVAYYAASDPSRSVLEIALEPESDTTPRPDGTGFRVVRTFHRGGWRIVVRGPASDDAARPRADALLAGLPLHRLGTVDTRCPDAGCGD